MASNNTAAFGIYKTPSCAEAAVDALRLASFRISDISVMFSNNRGTKDSPEGSTKASEGATKGASSETVFVGTLRWLTRIEALAIADVGPLIAAGPIVAALAGVGVEGAVGGVARALICLGIPEYEAKRYEERIKEGDILLSVHRDDSKRTARAREILKRTGAETVCSTDGAATDFPKTDKPRERAS